jgi:hypothetical protein
MYVQRYSRKIIPENKEIKKKIAEEHDADAT